MAPRKLWAVEMAVVVLGLLAMVQHSMQHSLRNPFRNSDDAKAFGLITTSESVEKALNESGEFVATSYVDLFGRRFVSGKIYGANVLYVRSSYSPSVHVGITVQIMADYFDLVGVVHLGLAGATNETLSIGSVSVPKFVGFTGFWEWLSKDSKIVGELDFGNFNYPVNGENLLGSIKYNKVDIYYNGTLEFENYWIYPHYMWLVYASRIEIDSVKVVSGLNASSSDIYVNNPAYREFIFDTFSCATVDMDSAAAGLAAKSNKLSFISFLGISNYAGAGSSPDSADELASKNVVAAVINFIWQATVPRPAHEAVDL